MKKINWIVVLLRVMVILLAGFLIYSILSKWENDVEDLKATSMFCEEEAQFEYSPYRAKVRQIHVAFDMKKNVSRTW